MGIEVAYTSFPWPGPKKWFFLRCCPYCRGTNIKLVREAASLRYLVYECGPFGGAGCGLKHAVETHTYSESKEAKEPKTF